MIRLDFTQLSVVVKCDECPWWYGFAFDRLHGWRVARDHEASVHPESFQAAKALDTAERAARRVRF
jgi:hypothetical protein